MDAPTSDAEIERLLAHSAWLSTLAKRLVHDSAAAEDLVQDTWHAALRSPPTRGGRERGWLSAVITNLARLRLRSEGARQTRERQVASAERIDGPDQLVARADVLRHLLGHVLALEEPYRSTIVARFVEGQSAAEIARRTATQESTVRMRTTRALQRLREKLANEHAGDARLGLGVLLSGSGSLEGATGATAGAGWFLQATSLGTGAWIMATMTKLAAIAVVVGGLWLGWRQLGSADGIPDATTAAAEQPVPKTLEVQAAPPVQDQRVALSPTPEAAVTKVEAAPLKLEAEAKPAPKRMPGMKPQSVEYYLGTSAFNPEQKVPSPTQRLALSQLVDDGVEQLRVLDSKIGSLASKYAGQKLWDRQFSTTTTGSWDSDHVGGTYRLQATGRDGIGGRIEILTGEFADLDVARDDALTALAGVESAVSALIASWN